MNRISVLMTVYNESLFVDYSIQSCLPYVDDLVIVEGSYQENIALGCSERSNDGTLDIIKKYESNPKVHIIYANEKSDPQQRNIGLEKIKSLNLDGWLLIIDGDEVYSSNMFSLIRSVCMNLEKNDINYLYFKSLTFVNDFGHYCEQYFPRLFKITPKCIFVNDNYMSWPDINLSFQNAKTIKNSSIFYFHYSFCKGREKFINKKKWWQSRFGKFFDYSWFLNDDNKILDKNHKIFEFKGNHPDIMKGHPLWKQNSQ